MKKGFTLFEILVVLAITGTIVVLTIPNLSSNINKRTNAKLLESTSHSLGAATKQIMMDERVTNLADTTMGTNVEIFISKYFKLTQYCGTTYTDCLASSYKSLDGENSVTTETMLAGNTFYCGGTQSGTVICLTNMTPDNGNTPGNSIAIIDVNGKKFPNKNGDDLFSFNIYTDGKIGNQYNTTADDADGITCRNYAGTAGYGGACYSKVVADGWEINY